MRKTALFRMINFEAAKLHRLQGKSLEYFGQPLPFSYLTGSINKLCQIYQDSFVKYESTKDSTKYHYSIMSKQVKPMKKKYGNHDIFEVWWLMAGLLGIALARQAVVIHEGTTEPPDADWRLAKTVRDFLYFAEPKKALKEIV